MTQSKAFVDASHALNELSHALALLESENASLRGAVQGFVVENVELRDLVSDWRDFAVGGADSLPDWNAIEADLESRMRNLGIEVDE